MAYSYSSHSSGVQEGLHVVLQGLFVYVLEQHDHRLEVGVRSREVQHKVFASGNSTVSGAGDYPHMPRDQDGEEDQENGISWAVDVTPYVDGKPLDPKKFGDDPWATSRWAYFAGIVFGEANNYLRAHANATGEHYRIRWGGNFDRDAEILEEGTWKDAYHFELERIDG